MYGSEMLTCCFYFTFLVRDMLQYKVSTTVQCPSTLPVVAQMYVWSGTLYMFVCVCSVLHSTCFNYVCTCSNFVLNL